MTAARNPTPASKVVRRTSFVRRIAARALLAGAGLCVGLLVAELGLWMADLPHVHKPRNTDVPIFFHLFGDGKVRHTNAKSVRQNLVYDSNPRGYFGAENEVEHVTNSLGFRGEEFHEDKPPGVFRIAFVGDSFTMGEGVKFQDTFSEVVRARLQQSLGAERTVESLNFGVGGANTCDERWCLYQFAWSFKPDLVVLGFVLNDAEASESWLPPEKPNGPYQINRVNDNVARKLREILLAEPPDRLIYRLRTARLIWRYFNDRQGTSEIIARYKSLYEDSNPDWQECRQGLQDIEVQCQEHGVPCLVVLFPVLYRLQNYPFSEIHAKVRDAVGDRAVLIDLLPALTDKKAEDLWVHPGDQHPNEIVHAIVARLIADEITSRGLIAPRAADPSNEGAVDLPQ